jgi:hypothetical protein
MVVNVEGIFTVFKHQQEENKEDGSVVIFSERVTEDK